MLSRSSPKSHRSTKVTELSKPAERNERCALPSPVLMNQDRNSFPDPDVGPNVCFDHGGKVDGDLRVLGLKSLSLHIGRTQFRDVSEND